jgi:hypothetical protein
MNVHLKVLMPDGPGVRLQCKKCSNVTNAGKVVVEVYGDGVFLGFLQATPSPVCSKCGVAQIAPKVFVTVAEGEEAAKALLIEFGKSGVFDLHLFNFEDGRQVNDPSRN